MRPPQRIAPRALSVFLQERILREGAPKSVQEAMDLMKSSAAQFKVLPESEKLVRGPSDCSGSPPPALVPYTLLLPNRDSSNAGRENRGHPADVSPIPERVLATNSAVGGKFHVPSSTRFFTPTKSA